MIIFKSKDFADKMRHITQLPTEYYSGGNKWSSWDSYRWLFDCVVSIKSVLWGWHEDKNAPHGGADYGSNGVPDFTCNGGLDYCTDVSTDFSNLVPGEYLCMKGTQYNHSGIYLGNGEVFDCTCAWGVDSAVISNIDKYGNRSRRGVPCLRWTYHGKLKWIDYSDTPTPTPSDKVNVTYRVKTLDYGWLPAVKNLEDYAGWNGSPITGIAIEVDKGSIWYQAHIKGGDWLAKVTGYDITDFENGWAGDGRIIDCVRIYYNTPEDIVKKSGYKKAKYKINNYDWQYDDETSNGQDGYAGAYGVDAKELRITIE